MNDRYNPWYDMCAVNVRRYVEVWQEVLRSFMSAFTVPIGGYHTDDNEHVAVV